MPYRTVDHAVNVNLFKVQIKRGVLNGNIVMPKMIITACEENFSEDQK